MLISNAGERGDLLGDFALGCHEGFEAIHHFATANALSCDFYKFALAKREACGLGIQHNDVFFQRPKIHQCGLMNQVSIRSLDELRSLWKEQIVHGYRELLSHRGPFFALASRATSIGERHGEMMMRSDTVPRLYMRGDRFAGSTWPFSDQPPMPTL